MILQEQCICTQINIGGSPGIPHGMMVFLVKYEQFGCSSGLSWLGLAILPPFVTCFSGKICLVFQEAIFSLNFWGLMFDSLGFSIQLLKCLECLIRVGEYPSVISLCPIFCFFEYLISQTSILDPLFLYWTFFY